MNAAPFARLLDQIQKSTVAVVDLTVAGFDVRRVEVDAAVSRAVIELAEPSAQARESVLTARFTFRAPTDGLGASQMWGQTDYGGCAVQWPINDQSGAAAPPRKAGAA
jgi:hypothetical protein